MEIKTLARGVLRELEVREYARTTLRQQETAFKTIECWFNNENGGKLNQLAVERYLTEIAMRLQAGDIVKPYYHRLRCAVERLYEYAETESISLICKTGSKLFQPSTNAIQMIENALSATELKDEFKRKLHVLLRKFFCFIENQGLDERDITREVMVSFIHHCSEDNSGNMEYVIRSLRVLVSYLTSVGIMVNEPDFKHLRPRKNRRKIIPAFSETELAAILNAIDKTTPIGKRDYAVILLSIGTGLRSGDIINLKLMDFDWKAKTISIVQGKTQNPLKIPINGQICNAVSDYILHSRPKVDYPNVFVHTRAPYAAFSKGEALGDLFDRACRKAGIEKKAGRSFHSLRRTFSTWLAAEEVHLTIIFQMLGQEKMDSSKPYLSFNDTQIFSCAMGFDDIPLKGGVYSGLY